MELTSDPWLVFDWFVVLLFCVWLCTFYPFILLNTQEEIDSEHQAELLAFGISFFCFLVYGGFAHKNGRHVILWNSITKLGNFLRNAIQQLLRIISNYFPEFLLKPVKYVLRLASSSGICYCGNLILDCLIYLTVGVCLFMTFITLMYGTPSYVYYFRSSVLGLLYVASSTVAFGQYTESRLINHVAYVFIHFGYICESLEYEKCYFATYIGMAAFLLNVIWYLLNPYGTQFRGRPSDEGESHGSPPGNPPGGDDDPSGGKPSDDPSGGKPSDDAPGESPQDDTRRPWKKPPRRPSKSDKHKSKSKKR